MTVEPGGLRFAFFRQDANGGHVRAVVSPPHGDPPEVVVVSFTTWKTWKDQACVLEPGEHPSLPNRSVVAYDRAEIVRVGELRRLVAAGDCRTRAPISGDLMGRIWDGARTTRRMSGACRQFLIDSGTPL